MPDEQPPDSKLLANVNTKYDQKFGHNGGDAGLTAFCHAQPILFGRYGGNDVGYPYNEKSYQRLNKVLDFTYKNTIGKFFFG